MARKPTIDPQVFRKGASDVPRISATATPSLRSVPSVTAFAQESITDTLLSQADDAQRMEQLSSNQFQVEQAFFDETMNEIKTQQRIEAEKEMNKVILGTEEAVSDVRLNSDLDSVAKNSVDAYDDVTQTVLENANLSEFQRNYLEPKLENARQSVALSGVKYQRAAKEEESRNTLKESVEAREFLVNKDPSKLDIALAEMEETINTIGENLPQAERTELLQRNAERLTMASVLGQVEKNPVLALQNIRSGIYNDTLTLKQVKSLEADAEIGIRKREAEINKLESARRSKIDADIGVAIHNAPLGQLPTFSQLDAMRENGSITDAQWEQHSKNLHGRLTKEDKDNELLTLGGVIFQNELPVNPENGDAVKAFNKVYDNMQPALAQMPLDQRVSYVSDVVTKHRIVPDTLKGELKLAATSNDPDQVKVAVDILDNVSNTSPYMVDQLMPIKDRQRLEMINDRLNIGAEFKEAVVQVDQQLSIVNQGSNEAIAAELSKLTQTMKFREKATGALTGWLDIFGGPETTGLDAFNVDRASTVYRIAYEDAYRDTRDANRATKAATEAVQGRFNRTQINGVDQIMEFAPETYYSIKNEDNDWMRVQMLETAREATKNSMFATETMKNFDERVRIIPDAIHTPRGAAKNRPGYNLVIIGEDGLPIQLNPPGELFFFDPAERRKELVDEAQVPFSQRMMNMITGGE